MRTSILSAAFVAALGVTTWAPSRADAQVIVYPQISTYPYAYSSFYNPAANYAYQWVTPYSSWSSYGWSNPYNYGTWSWYTANPYYAGYNSGRYGLGWRGRPWRW